MAQFDPKILSTPSPILMLESEAQIKEHIVEVNEYLEDFGYKMIPLTCDDPITID